MNLINLDLVFNAITGIVNPLIKEKIQRSEVVIKILKQFNLDPEHPPADFSGVYAYALVEYGVGKPKAFLELFRQETIKKAFRKALDHNNPSLLLYEVDAFIETFALGDEIKSLGLDVRREIAAFYIVFSEVAKRTRNPSDTLMSQQIGSLHKRIASLQEQLDRLPTLEGIRIEMARLATQSYPALSGAEVASENKCRAIALAQQIRSWFETLGYRIEKYEIWAEEYFELIINVPVRRSFDRILIRGVAGEVGLSDVMALRLSVETQKTDEGWLVTTRRISRAARDEVKKEENRRLDCYTFDELIDLDADFSGYLEWLEAEIKRRKIDTNYVPLACTKEEIDPVTRRPIGVSRYEEEDGWIDRYIDLWLSDPVKEHISILGEFGTGKTWFAFHYAWVALQRYQDAQRRGVERPRLPLVITLRDFAKALNVENVLAGFFFTQHNIRLNSDVFEQLNRMGKLLLIFDGFDEMAAKVDRQQMINNFWELGKVVVPGAKVILTCRTEHFPEAQSGRALLNAELQASTKQLTGETPQFEVLELEKFNDEQIRQVLSYQAEAATVEQVMGNGQLLDLARRPVMTELILEALPDIEAGKPVDMSRVYLYAVRRKMERDIKAERTFTSLAEKLYFLCELSWEMLSTDQMSINYRLFPDRIRRLFGSIVQEEKDLDHWHYDMMAQTMLIRNASGDYTPAHRSLLEFFVAYKFAAELGAASNDFIELAQAQSCLDTNAMPVNYTWSGYFLRQLDNTGRSVIIPPLRGFISEPLEKLRQTFGQSILTKAVMDLLVPMIGIEAKEAIINVIEATREKTEDEAGYVGGNAATLVLKVDKDALESANFSNTVIKGADFSNTSLREVNFTQANLTNSVFTKILEGFASVTFSSDGKFLATCGNNGTIRLLRTDSFKEFLSYQGHTNRVNFAAFSPDNKILASASSDQTVKLWDVSTGKCLKILDSHRNSVASVTFSSDGKMLASSSFDKTVKLWSASTGECLTTFQGHTDWVYSVCFSPDGKFLASCSRDQTIKLWKLDTKECSHTFHGHIRAVRCITFTANGKVIASGGSDKTIKLWDLETRQCLNTLQEHSDTIWSIAFSQDNKLMASCSDDRTVKLWNIETFKCITTLQEHTKGMNRVAFSPDDKLMITSDSSTIKLWNVKTSQCLNTLQGYSSRINSVIFHPNNLILASSSQDRKIRLWNINTGKLKILPTHGQVYSAVFSPNGHILASGDWGTVRVWDANSCKPLNTLKSHTATVMSTAISPDNKILASGCSHHNVKLWNILTGQCLNTLSRHTHWVTSLAFNSDGKILASGSYDSTIILWNSHTGEYLCALKGHTNSVSSVAFDFQGKILASASFDHTIKLWNVNTGECIRTFDGHSNWVNSVIFNTTGEIVASGSVDGTLKLWNVQTGQCIKTLYGHNNFVGAVAFSCDGKVIASGGTDNTIQLWDVATGECFKTLCDRPYEKMNITCVKGLTDVEIATLKVLGAVENGEE
ncbi:WD-40 repeat protein [Rivularia sp. IAM M-261]|nr:WD-40 repeat protein [Rivularia sp. IAM M-261]